MSWKQIMYPPDRAPLPVEPPFLRLASPRLELHVDRATGRGVRLVNRATGTDYFAAGGVGITFRLYDTQGVWLDGPAVRPTAVHQPDAQSVEVLYDAPRQHGVTVPVRLRLRYRLAADGALAADYAIEHLGGAAVIERVQFPVLCGLHEFAGAETQLLLPFIGGERRPQPVTQPYSDFEYIYPNEAMSFMALYSGREGLYLASCDPQFRWTVLRGRVVKKHAPPDLELIFETTPFLRAGETFASQTFDLCPYTGDWHAAADRYRAWLAQWFVPPAMPDSVRELRGLCELFFDITKESGAIERYDSTLLRRYAEDCYRQIGVEIAHLCGYHEGGFDAHYPLYEPLARIGGATGLKAIIAEYNAMPGRTTDIYINCRITDTGTDWWSQKGRHWACTSKDGTFFYEYYNGRYFTIACPAIPERRQWWYDKVEQFARAWGIAGLQVDQPHTTARECWAYREHGHRTPFDHWGPGFIELFAEMRRRLRAINPEFWSWGEAASDVFGQFFDISCCYVRYPDQKVAFGETDFATRDFVNDWRGYGMPEVFRYCCPQLVMLQAPRIVAGDPEDLIARINLIFAFSAILYWPGLEIGFDLERVPRSFRDYVRRLYDARQEARDTMIHGWFVDDIGLTATPPELYAKAYVSLPPRPPALSVVAINRDRKSPLAARLTIDPALLRARRPETAHLPADAAAWHWSEPLLGGARGEGTAAEIEIPPNRAALVRFVARS